MPDIASTLGQLPLPVPPKDTVRSGKKNFSLSTQKFLPIAEIKEDTLMLKNGGMRAIVKVHAMNFNLKSEVEQQGIIAGYQSFVNTLLFPIQIVIRSTHLNIDPYISQLQKRAKDQPNELLKNQTIDYANFMEKLVNVADIMQKSYYIVIPMDGGTKQHRGLLTRFFEWLNVDDTKAKAMQRSRDFKMYSKLLRDRVTLIQSGLENVGITIERLTTQQIAELMYEIYNPDTSQKEKFMELDDLNLQKDVTI